MIYPICVCMHQSLGWDGSVSALGGRINHARLQSSGIPVEQERTVTSTCLRFGGWTPVDVHVKPQQLREIPAPQCVPHSLASGVEVADCHNPHHLGLRLHVFQGRRRLQLFLCCGTVHLEELWKLRAILQIWARVPLCQQHIAAIVEESRGIF